MSFGEATVSSHNQWILWNRHIKPCSILHLRLLKDLCHTLTVFRRHFTQKHTLTNLHAMKPTRTAWTYPIQAAVGGLWEARLINRTDFPPPRGKQTPTHSKAAQQTLKRKGKYHNTSTVTALLCFKGFFVGLGLWVFLWLGMVWFFGSVFLTGLICLWGSEAFF